MNELGRLAFRIEGDMWVAYYAMTHTMEGAILVGSIRRAFVTDRKNKAAFIRLMKQGAKPLLEEITQGKVKGWSTRPAPESERGGNA